MRLTILVTAGLISVAQRPAAADSSPDLELGVRWAGGFGAALDTPRPIFLGSFGMDALVPIGSGHALGLGLDAIWREYPEASKPPDRPEATVALHYRWRRSRALGKWTPWFGGAVGYRQRVGADPGDDPLLGAVRHHGVSLGFEGGGEFRISSDTRLALFFNWTLGCYLTATRDQDSRYTEAYDEPPPPPRDVACIATSSSTYSLGLRWSLQLN